MTVCIAAMFRWNYAPLGEEPRMGIAGLCISDRMITAGDLQYEPRQRKMAFLSQRMILLIAGDYTLHSQALKIVHSSVSGNPKITPYDAAILYGRAIQDINRKAAEDIILAPLNLNTDTFLAQQRELSEGFVERITNQLQNIERPDVAAIIIGLTDDDSGHIYEIDKNGVVLCYDDVGFSAIGIGAYHARSTLMQAGFINNWGFASALTVAYAAKRAAETAPGVGKATDIHLILRDGWQPLSEAVQTSLERVYDEYAVKRTALVFESIQKLGESFSGSAPQKDINSEQLFPQANSATEGSSAGEGTKNKA